MLDFLVIGGGIAGMSAAARLSGLGRVTVLEAEAGLGYHASGRSAAMFEQSYGLPSTIALNRASRDYLSAANGGVLTPRGMLVIGTADTGAAFARDMREMDMQTISPAEAAALVPCLKPDVVVEVAYTSEALDIDTDRLMQNFARQARENGASVLT
ncbi:MAG: NAD(P)/FAD-dependent oxidoreductase, partial [Paracoccaceae bacterium]